jgi:hypothetical protein
MLSVTLLSLMLAVAPPPMTSNPVCQVGRVALNDLKSIDKSAQGEMYYGIGSVFPGETDLLEACPNLKSRLPNHLTIATEAILERRKDIRSSSPVTILGVQAPSISRDGHHAAVHMGHYCNGLCGAWYTVTYTLTAKGWQHDKYVAPPAVS